MSAAPIPAGSPAWLAAPHRLCGNSYKEVLRAWIFAASIVALAGGVLFGAQAMMVVALSVASAMAIESVVDLVFRRETSEGTSHAALTGLLLALTLPPTATWYVVVFANVVSILMGKTLFGGFGHYFMQPAILGRVVTQVFFGRYFSYGAVALAPVLAPGHLFVGDLDQDRAVRSSTYLGWTREPTPDLNAEAWRLPRPVHALREFADGRIESDGRSVFQPLLRDALPPWTDTVLGVVPGGIGETCSLALIVAGIYLIYRGFLRWQLPVMMIVAAMVAVAIFPVRHGGEYDWFPAVTIEDGQAVGVAYVLYHLTSGSLLLGAFLIAGDMTVTPMRVRGQILYATGIGVLTIFMRLYGNVEADCYWSILIMNWLVPSIDRKTRRVVLGMPR